MPKSSSNLGLECPCEILVGLVGDHRQPIDRFVVYPFASFGDGQPQATPDLLAFLLR